MEKKTAKCEYLSSFRRRWTVKRYSNIYSEKHLILMVFQTKPLPKSPTAKLSLSTGCSSQFRRRNRSQRRLFFSSVVRMTRRRLRTKMVTMRQSRRLGSSVKLVPRRTWLANRTKSRKTHKSPPSSPSRCLLTRYYCWRSPVLSVSAILT